MTVYLPVWHSNCTRARFTILVSRNGELAIHSGPLICLQKQITKLASGLFDCSPLLRDNSRATNHHSLTSSCGHLFCVTITWRQIPKAWLQVTAVDVLPACRMWLLNTDISHAVLYWVKRSMSQSATMIRQVRKIHY